jgi:hypothetical protein
MLLRSNKESAQVTVGFDKIKAPLLPLLVLLFKVI